MVSPITPAMAKWLHLQRQAGNVSAQRTKLLLGMAVYAKGRPACDYSTMPIIMELTFEIPRETR